MCWRFDVVQQFNSLVPEIDSLILIDRTVDLVTPMMFQMTYEGLIDEMFGIANSFIEVDAELVTRCLLCVARAEQSADSVGGVLVAVAVAVGCRWAAKVPARRSSR